MPPIRTASPPPRHFPDGERRISDAVFSRALVTNGQSLRKLGSGAFAVPAIQQEAGPCSVSTVFCKDFQIFSVQFFPLIGGLHDFQPVLPAQIPVTFAADILFRRHFGQKRPEKILLVDNPARSEERRVGKECRSRW